MKTNLAMTDRIVRIGIALPLCIILICSHLLFGQGYYFFVTMSVLLIATGLSGWCPFTWILRKIKEGLH